MSKFSVYIIENNITDKVYIGITSKSTEFRWKGHLKRLRKGNHRGYCLYNAMSKYGVDNFSIRLIDISNSWEESCDKEKMYIQKYDSMKNGYNMTLGGEGGYGYKYTDKQRKERSIKYYGKISANTIE